MALLAVSTHGSVHRVSKCYLLIPVDASGTTAQPTKGWRPPGGACLPAEEHSHPSDSAAGPGSRPSQQAALGSAPPMLSTICYAKIQEALGKAQRGGGSVSPEQREQRVSRCGSHWCPVGACGHLAAGRAAEERTPSTGTQQVSRASRQPELPLLEGSSCPSRPSPCTPVPVTLCPSG